MSADISASIPLTRTRLTPENTSSTWNPKYVSSRKSVRARASRTSRMPITRVEKYFEGPLEAGRHSKWPLFLRLRGSILPKLILPLTLITIWAVIITVFSEFVHELGFASTLLTVLGIVVGLSLGFRSSTAYERYGEGRKLWGTLHLTIRNMARLIWVHAKESKEPELGKFDLIAKVSALNLLKAFAVALKHRLRFEPSTHYPDLEPYVAHLDTFASRADQTTFQQEAPTAKKVVGEYLGFSFAESNPRKLLKRSRDNLGNLPLEILYHLSSYIESLLATKQLPLTCQQTMAMSQLNMLADILTNTERILNTPIPLAYTISISQITYVYLIVLPFQIRLTLGWMTIPATILAAYVILGVSTIGSEIEDPFGHDVNDLPLDQLCREIITEIDSMTSTPAPVMKDFVKHSQNIAFFPISTMGVPDWESHDVSEIREVLKERAHYYKNSRTPIDNQIEEELADGSSLHGAPMEIEERV